jgi:tetratricopeptide (TPR) repeat protein
MWPERLRRSLRRGIALSFSLFAVLAIRAQNPSMPAPRPESSVASAATPSSAASPSTNQTAQQQSGTVVCPVNTQTAPPLSGPLAAARDLYRIGKFDEAVAAYNAILPSGVAESAAAYAGLSRVYLKQKRVDDADLAAQKAVALTPGRAPAIVAQGEVYFREGKLSEAEKLFLTPLLACNLDARAYLGLTRLYRATLNFKIARKYIEQAYKLDPGDPDIRRLYMTTLSGAERIEFLKQYLAGLTDDDAETRTNMERELAMLEQRDSQSANDCRLMTKVSETHTNLEPLLYDPTHIRGYGLNVKVNGTSAKLMLDTGASGILVDSKIAEKAGVKRLVDQDIHGIGDRAAPLGYLGYAEKIQIGELEFQNCYVDVVPGRDVIGDDGLIGADVFRHFLVDLDMPDGKVKLSPLPPIPDEPATTASLETQSASVRHLHNRYIAPEMKDYAQIFLFGHDMLIPTHVNGSPAKLFLIDTGSFDDTISPSAAREVTKINQDDDVKVKGLNGYVKKVYTANNVTLHFSHFEQKRQDLVTFDLTHISDAAGTEISGVLGFAMLRMLDMKIDYRDGLVNFTYDEKRFH